MSASNETPGNAPPSDPAATQPPSGDPSAGEGSTPAPPDPLRGSRTSGIWVAVLVLSLVLLLLAVFILQNTQKVEVSFFGWDGHAPLAAAVLIAAASGALLVASAGYYESSSSGVGSSGSARLDARAAEPPTPVENAHTSPRGDDHMARMAPHTVVLHGHDLSYVDSGSGPVVLFIHGILGSQRQWAHLVDKMDDDHRVLAARPLRSRRVGQAAGGLLAQRARRDHARSPRSPRDRAGHARRALARRRHRDAVLLPLPRAGRSPRPGLQRRPGARGEPGPALRDPARRGAGAQRPRLGPRPLACGGAGPWRVEGRLATRRRHRRDLAGVQLARGPREPARLPGHHPCRHRHRRAEHQRPRPPGGLAADPDPDRVGLQGPDDPGLARASACSVRSPTAGSSCSRAPATSRTSTTRTGSRACSASSSPTAPRRSSRPGQKPEALPDPQARRNVKQHCSAAARNLQLACQGNGVSWWRRRGGRPALGRRPDAQVQAVDSGRQRRP